MARSDKGLTSRLLASSLAVFYAKSDGWEHGWGRCVTIEGKAEQLKQLARAGKTKGYVLYDEIDELLPNDYEGGPELDDILSELAGNGVEVLQDPRAERDKEFNEDEF